MDPLSPLGAAASIVQLVEVLTNVVTYAYSIKDSSKERAELAGQASNLVGLLTVLQNRVREVKSEIDPWFESLRLLWGSNSPLIQLQGRMEKLARVLAPPSDRLEKITRAVIWPVEKGEVEKTLAKIEQIKTFINIALQNDTFELSLAIKRDIEDMKEGLQKVAEEAATRQSDSEIKGVTAWLSGLEFSAKQIDFFNRREPKTGEWLLENPTFIDWLSGTEKTLWCHGLPGAGKTIIAATLIDWLKNHHLGGNNVVAYLYCSYKAVNEQTTEKMMGSLLKQLIQHGGSISDELKHLYQDHTKSNTDLTLDELDDLLEAEIRERPVVYIVIDALDECPEAEGRRAELLAHIQQLPQNARIIITSRNSPMIDEAFRDGPNIEIRAADQDIELYIKSRIRKNMSLAKLVQRASKQGGSDLEERIIATLKEKSKGMFLLAHLQMDSLSKQLSLRKLKEALDTLPKELNQMYDEVMHRIQNQDENQASLAHRVLYWISYAYRELTVSELQHALAVEPGDDDLDEDGLLETGLLVSVCAGLVTVDEESNRIRLVHPTTHAYLRDNLVGRFPEAQAEIAKVCVTYLSFGPFAREYCFEDREIIARLRGYPFLGYAVNYWGDHVQSQTSIEVRDLTLKFLSNSISIMSAVQAMTADFSGPPRALQVFFYNIDGRRSPNLTRLHLAAAFQLTDIAQHLLEVEKVDVNASENGCTPLQLAAGTGGLSMVRLLLKAGADTEAQGSGGAALHQAVEYGNESVVLELLESGADCNLRGRQYGTPLMTAIFGGHVNIAKLLIKWGADANEAGETSSPPLHRAVIEGSIEMVDLLLSHGADLSGTNMFGETALHVAATSGDGKIVQRLIDKGADLSVGDERGNTALHRSAPIDVIETTKVLLRNNADVLIKNKEGENVVEATARSAKNRDMLKLLLEHIGKGDELEKYRAPTPLHTAVIEADRDAVSTLLEKGEDPNAVVDQLSLLHHAIKGKNLDVLRLLLAQGADVGIKASGGNTPLHLAVALDYDDAVQLLIDHGSDIHATNMSLNTPLHVAAATSNASIARRLLDNGADINARDRYEFTPIVAAIMSQLDTLSFGGLTAQISLPVGGHHQHSNKIRAMLDLLIDRGANLEVQSLNQPDLLSLAINHWFKFETPDGRAAIIRRLLQAGLDETLSKDDLSVMLRLAASYGLPEVALIFLERGGDVNYTTGTTTIYPTLITPREVSGRTALHAAAWRQSAEMVRLLIDVGADVSIADGEGSTPLHVAVESGMECQQVIDVLLEYGGADINARQYPAGATALHCAAGSGNILMVQYLLQRGADIAAVDVNGKTALGWAEEKGHEPMVSFLKKYCDSREQ